jgi:MFS family permease
MPYMTLMPVFAKNIFHGGANTMGFLMSAAGAGAFFGAVYLASRKSVLGLGRHIYIAGAVFGAAMIGFSLSPVLPLAFVMLFIAGAGMIILTASSNTILQTISDEDKRGRVMSFYAIAFLGVSTFGNLLYGWLAGIIGVRMAVTIGGSLVIAGAAAFSIEIPSIRKCIKPIYIKKGIITEIEAGLMSAAEPVESPGKTIN